MRSNHTLVKSIAALKPILKSRFGVNRIGFTGWWTNQQRITSDLTIVVELDEPMGWRFYALKGFLEAKLQMRIDLTTHEGVKPVIREEFESMIRFV
jgi:predicted nucleotidyltransferase